MKANRGQRSRGRHGRPLVEAGGGIKDHQAVFGVGLAGGEAVKPDALAPGLACSPGPPGSC